MTYGFNRYIFNQFFVGVILLFGLSPSQATPSADQGQLQDSFTQSKLEQIRLDSSGLEYALKYYLEINSPLSLTLKQQVQLLTNRLGAKAATSTLFKQGFSSLTQGRFKQVSSSVVKMIQNLDLAKLGLFSKELMKVPKLRHRAYSMYIAYRLLDYHHEWVKESQLMMYSLMNDSFFECKDYLRLRFQERVEHYLRLLKEDLKKLSSRNNDVEVLKVFESVKSENLIRDLGFWLRRELDQSRESLFALVKVVVQTDLSWASLPSLDKPPPSQSGLSLQSLMHVYRPLIEKTNSHSDMYLGDLPSLLSNEGLNQGVAFVLDKKQKLKDSKDKSISAEAKGQWAITKKLWEMFSTYKLEKPLEENEKKRPFIFLNPRFIFWLNDHLVPNSNTEPLLSQLKEIYNQRYARLGQVLLQSRMYLKKHLNLEREKLNYSLARFDSSFNDEKYLQKRFSQVLTQAFPEQGDSVFTPALAIGFWLKREIDGSAEYAESSLKLFMSQLDPNFDKQLTEE